MIAHAILPLIVLLDPSDRDRWSPVAVECPDAPPEQAAPELIAAPDTATSDPSNSFWSF